jgi:hypothetical protein
LGRYAIFAKPSIPIPYLDLAPENFPFNLLFVYQANSFLNEKQNWRLPNYMKRSENQNYLPIFKENVFDIEITNGNGKRTTGGGHKDLIKL